MSTLAQTYALACGVPLSKPWMMEAFYPLEHPLDKVILLHAFAGATVEQNGQTVATFPAKIYSHFDEVVALMKPAVEMAGYRFYQIGGPGEPVLKGVESVVGKTDLQQCAYLVRNCALLIGNDSMWAHWRGACDGAQVHVYGSTSKPHFPHWHNPEKSAFIESHRGGKKPTYQAVENPKTIDWVPPELVANASLKALGLPPVQRQSLYIGETYQQPMIQLVPDSVLPQNVNIPGALVVRMDLATDKTAAEQALIANLQIRKCAIITSQEINLNVLAQLKPNVAGVRVEVDNVSAGWIKAVKRLGIQVAFFSNERDSVALAKKRLDLFETCLFDQFLPPTKADAAKGMSVYLNKEVDIESIIGRLKFKTKKFLLSNGQVYLSEAHWRAGKVTPTADQNVGDVIDCDSFWEGLTDYYLFTE